METIQRCKIMTREELQNWLRTIQFQDERYNVYCELESSKPEPEKIVVIVISRAANCYPVSEEEEIHSYPLFYDEDEYSDKEELQRLKDFAETQLHYDKLEYQVSVKQLEADIKSLPPMGKLIICSRFQLFGVEKMTFRQLANKLEISEGKAQYIKDNTIHKLRDAPEVRRKRESRKKWEEEMLSNSNLDGIYYLMDIGLRSAVIRFFYPKYRFINDMENVNLDELVPLLSKVKGVSEKTANESIEKIKEFIRIHSKK